MSHTYDITLKDILKAIPTRFLKMLTGFESGSFLDTEFTDTRVRRPDLLIELPDNTIFHLELQSTNDKDMHYRMLEYCSLILWQYKKNLRQMVLYVGTDTINMQTEIVTKALNYKYEIKDIRDTECKELLKSDNIEDTILAILCKSEDETETIRAILKRLSLLKENERKDGMLKLLNLSRLRHLDILVKKEVENMPATIEVEKDSLYMEGMQRGIEKGIERGIEKGLETGLKKGMETGLLRGVRALLRLKYGDNGTALANKAFDFVKNRSFDELEELVIRANSIDELESSLTTKK